MILTDAPDPRRGPLSGLRVVDLTINVLGPVCTQILGDMGADIIKVEEPKGDYTRHVGPRVSDDMGALFLGLNRNKRSIVLNLKDSQDSAVLTRLLETADVMVHAMRPGAIDRLGLTYDKVRAIKPDLIYASATGFRPGSSRTETPAYDDVVQGLTGTAAMNGWRDGVPDYLPTVIADKHSGYVLANAITSALFWRERTGEGQEVHVPMMESVIVFNLLEHLWGRALPATGGKAGYTRLMNADRRPYRTADGYLCVMANTDAQWQRFLELLGHGDLARDPRYERTQQRSANIQDLYAIVAKRLVDRTTADWGAALDQADIPNGPASTFDELFEDPYLLETGFFETNTHPTEGAMTLPGIAPSFSACTPSIRRLPPRLGADTHEILNELAQTPDRNRHENDLKIRSRL